MQVTQALDQVLGPRHSAVQTVVYFKWACGPEEKMEAIDRKLEEAQSARLDTITIAVDDVQKMREASMSGKLNELQITTFIFEGIKSSQLFDNFIIRSQNQDLKLQVCRSYSSREDLSMYHKDKFVQKEMGHAATFVRVDNDEDEDDGYNIYGSATEVKPNHLQCHSLSLTSPSITFPKPI